MKKIIFTASVLMSFFTCFSQAENEIIEKSDRSNMNIIPLETSKAKETSVKEVKSTNKTQTISKRAGEPQVVHDENYYSLEIAKIDQHISAIEQKTAYINSIPEEKSLAENNGWFIQMANVKTQLMEKRKVLVTKLNK